MTDGSPAILFGLLLIRIGMVVVAAPPFNGLYFPATVKVGLILLLGVILLPLVDVTPEGTPVGLAVIAARETAIGLSLGLAVRMLVAGAEMAGYLVGFQLGFAYAATVDPQTGARNNVIASLYGSVALLTFLAIDGHHEVLRALLASYQALPIGTGGLDGSLVDVVSRMLGIVFDVGAQLAAPVVIVLLIVELAIGLASRAAPALNLMAIGFPIRLAVGLFALGVTVEVVPGTIARVAPSVFELATRAATAFR